MSELKWWIDYKEEKQKIKNWNFRKYNKIEIRPNS